MQRAFSLQLQECSLSSHPPSAHHQTIITTTNNRKYSSPPIYRNVCPPPPLVRKSVCFLPGGNLLKRVQWKKIYEILKYCCCATKNEFNNTAWAQGFKKYLRASLFLHNLRVLVTFMIMSRRNVLLFFWHCFWKHNEILCFPVLKH